MCLPSLDIAFRDILGIIVDASFEKLFIVSSCPTNKFKHESQFAKIKFFLHQIGTGDEKWVNHDNFERKTVYIDRSQ